MTQLIAITRPIVNATTIADIIPDIKIPLSARNLASKFLSAFSFNPASLPQRNIFWAYQSPDSPQAQLEEKLVQLQELSEISPHTDAGSLTKCGLLWAKLADSSAEWAKNCSDAELKNRFFQIANQAFPRAVSFLLEAVKNTEAKDLIDTQEAFAEVCRSYGQYLESKPEHGSLTYYRLAAEEYARLGKTHQNGLKNLQGTDEAALIQKAVSAYCFAADLFIKLGDLAPATDKSKYYSMAVNNFAKALELKPRDSQLIGQKSEANIKLAPWADYQDPEDLAAE